MSSDPRSADPQRRARSDSDRDLPSLAARYTARLLRLQPRRGPRITGQRELDTLAIPRWALSLAILLTLLLFLALLIVFFLPIEARASTADGINFDKPSKDWYQGPVRYIITKQEVKAYKALDNEIDRASFIDWFWQRRDIIPSTPDNEFRDRFEQRVYEATRKFNFTTKPGWKTDMGKVYILVGPPDEINSDIMASSHRGIITWVYRQPPFPDLPRNTVMAFARDASGEFVLSTNPTLDSDVARGLQFRHNKITIDDRVLVAGRDPVLLDQGVPFSQSPLETMIIFGRMQQLPPEEEKLFRSFVTSHEFYGAIPVDSRVDFYKAEGGATFTTITIGFKSSAVQYKMVKGKDVPDVSVFGKLVNKDKPDEEYTLGRDGIFSDSLENAAAGPNDLLIFQAAGGYPPGQYRLVLGVQDRVSKKLAAYRKDIIIPDLGSQALALSTVTLAATMDPTDYTPSEAKPFFLGRFRIVPQPDNTFNQQDDLNVYFQVYNPAREAGTKQPRLRVSYTFATRDAQGEFQSLGTYQVKESRVQVQGYAVPLSKWPPGEYQLTVTVNDLISGGSVSSQAGFVIRP
jgi:GWxTD domain-containing protein